MITWLGASLGNSADNYIFPSPPLSFTPTSSVVCIVNSTIQLRPLNTPPIGPTSISLRHAVIRQGGAPQIDDPTGVFVVANGVSGNQPAVSWSSMITVPAGQTVSLGVSMRDVHLNPTFVGAFVDYRLVWNCA